MKKIILISSILLITACGLTNINDVGFKDRVSNSLSKVDLVTNTVLLESLSDDELSSAVFSLDNIIKFKTHWSERIKDNDTPLTIDELNGHYLVLISSYKALEAIVKTHWGEFTKLQQTSFRMIQADLVILNISYQSAITSESLNLATNQAIAMTNIAMRIMAVP